MRLTFAGHPVEPPSGGRGAQVWGRCSELRRALRPFVMSWQAADELIASGRGAGRVEYKFVMPEGVGFATPGGGRYEVFPPGHYVVREMRDGFVVIWRLEA